MKSRYAIFQCNKCNNEVGHNVLIAEDASEFDKLFSSSHSTIRRVF